MWAKHPDIAQKWVDEGASSKGLPMHKAKAGSVRRAAVLAQMKTRPSA